VTAGQVDIEGEVRDVPEGGVVRVGPDPIRKLCNHTDDTHVWVLFGAPLAAQLRFLASACCPTNWIGSPRSLISAV
jgi:hypothetical protein